MIQNSKYIPGIILLFLVFTSCYTVIETPDERFIGRLPERVHPPFHDRLFATLPPETDMIVLKSGSMTLKEKIDHLERENFGICRFHEASGLLSAQKGPEGTRIHLFYLFRFEEDQWKIHVIWRERPPITTPGSRIRPAVQGWTKAFREYDIYSPTSEAFAYAIDTMMDIPHESMSFQISDFTFHDGGDNLCNVSPQVFFEN